VVVDGACCSVMLAPTMPRRIPTPLLALAVISVLAILTVLFLSVGRTPPRPPLPNPNGYNDFLKAAALLNGDVYQLTTLDHDGLRALVSTNAESLRLLRVGLARDCSLPADSAMANVPGMMSDLAQLKSLARLLVDEGQLAEMEGRYGDAARSYLDAIRFGNEMSRGGFIINRLVGIACEAIGDGPLSKLVPKLNGEEARPVIAELEKIDNAGVTLDEVLRNESRFARYQLGKGFNPITWAMTRWQTLRARQRFELRDKRVAAHVRLLTAELAARCYQSEQGRAPTGLAQLVPKYLQRVPLDPFSGRPMLYRQQSTYWLLYSVGEDGVDDGGTRASRSVAGTVTRGDLFYDSPY
jgi:hypothetical protein